jgi:two-component system cell cycle sensor histidine kinase/response regulator CckA
MQNVAELAIAADELPVAIWMGRVPSGEVVYTNAAFRDVLGIEPPDDAARGAFVGPYGVHTTTGEPYPEDRMPFERVIAARTTVVIDDLVIHRHDGRRVSLRVFAKPIFDADGNMTHVLEAFTDISREVEAERARAEGERRLARSQRLEAIGQLVAGIAHDFNNLLTVTKLATSALRTDETNAERLETIEQISAVTDSAVELIKNLIGFARRERRIAAPISFEAVVQPVIDMAGRTFDRATPLRADLDARGAAVVGDPSQLQQMIMNLVINARDAVAGSGEVMVRTRARVVTAGAGSSLAAGSYVVLEVCDTGPGIPAAVRERIFEPYFTTKTQGPVKGTGLGLSIVHGIVESHGGVIEVDDNVPHGAIVRVLLPRVGDLPRPAVASTEGPSGAAPAASAGEGRLVLVVEDEPLVRATTVASLAAHGFRVIAAADGATAVELFRDRRAEVSAVVLDMVMPGMRGRDVYLALRELCADVPVLLVTGSAFDDDAEQMVAMGASAFLPKPYNAKQLVAGLESVGVR